MIRKLMVGAAMMAVAVTVSATANAESVIRLHSWLSPKHHQNTNVMATWAKRVAEATKGRVRVQVSFPPRVHPKTMFDRTKTGVADATWAFHGYTPGRFVLTQIVELPGLGSSAYEASVAYWKIHQKYLAKANEHAGVKTLMVFSHGPGILQTKKKITSVDDIKGMKIRVAGGISSEVGKALGVVGILAPASKVYQILSQGVADGIVMPMETKKGFNLKEVAKYNLVLPGGLYYGSFFFVMNQAKFDSLPREDRLAIDSVSGAPMVAYTGRDWAAADKEGYEAAKAYGNEMTVAGPKLQAAINAKLAGLERDWIKRANTRGIDAAKALAELRAEVKRLKSMN